MTANTDALCGDYPAPCNCDDPETHDGAVFDLTNIIPTDVVNSVQVRLTAVIEEYKAYAQLANALAMEENIPMDDGAGYVRALQLARMALVLQKSVTSNRDTSVHLIKQAIREGSSMEGIRLAVEVQEFITQE